MARQHYSSGFRKLLDMADTVLLDCDGVLWHGDDIIRRSDAAVKALKALGKRVLLVTNNSTRSRAQYVAKCQRLDIAVNDVSEVISSAAVCAHFLVSQNCRDNVYVVGSPGLGEELKAAGISHFGVGPDHLEDYSTNGVMLRSVPLQSNVNAVVVGFDSHFSYPKMMKAASYLRNEKCLFVATNEDSTIPSDNKNSLIPGTGCFVRSIALAAGRSPVVIGKPHRPLWDYIRDAFPDVTPERTIMIGDRSETDIQFGRLHGLHSVCVLTGHASVEQIERDSAAGLENHIPHLIADDFASLLDL